MPSPEDSPEEVFQQIAEALDLMVKAGWVISYDRSPERFGVEWSEAGKQRMGAISFLLGELGLDNVTVEVWWAVRALAMLRHEKGV
jgi:hypothetical protein